MARGRPAISQSGRRFNCVLGDDLDARLEAESDRSGVSLSEIARRAISAYLRMSDQERLTAYVSEREERRTAEGYA